MQAPASSFFGGILSKQIRRALPIYFLCILFFFILFKIPNRFEGFRHTPGDVLKHALSYPAAKTTRATRIPKKIWQSWKTDPLEFETRDSDRARTWTKLNPGYRYEVLTDGNDMEYVETHFGPDGINRPDIVETYRSLTAMIIKADLLRYLVMYVEGGYYADIDVSVIREIDTWIPPQFNQTDVDIIIGVEIDEPDWLNHTILGPKSRSFCQWTFACKPRVPVMMRLIDHVLHWLNEVAQRQDVPIANVTLDFNEVIVGTGPSAFTDAVLADMTAQTGSRPPWDTFHNISEPVLVGNTLVLTVEAFAAGQGHSNSGNHDSEKALVKHHYHASLWPSRHPRYSHPAFGMVEECNWKPECVHAWDRNTTMYEDLEYDARVELIQFHEKELAEKFDREEAEKADREREDAERQKEDLKNKCIDAELIPRPEEKPEESNESKPEEAPEENKDEPPPPDTPAAETREHSEEEHPDMKRLEVASG